MQESENTEPRGPKNMQAVIREKRIPLLRCTHAGGMAEYILEYQRKKNGGAHLVELMEGAESWKKQIRRFSKIPTYAQLESELRRILTKTDRLQAFWIGLDLVADEFSSFFPKLLEQCFDDLDFVYPPTTGADLERDPSLPHGIVQKSLVSQAQPNN